MKKHVCTIFIFLSIVMAACMQHKLAKPCRDQNPARNGHPADTYPASSLVRLSNGITAELNTGSLLEVSHGRHGTDRTTTLRGEGFFNVRPQRKPFKVVIARHHGPIVASCSEGSFNIKAYRRMDSVFVTSLDAALCVTEGNQRIELAPGQTATAGASGRLRIIKDANPYAYCAWQKDEFALQGLAVEEVLEKFAEWYDVTVKYDSLRPAGSYHMEGFKAMGLRFQLEQMEKMGGFHYQIRNDTVFVSR